MRACLLSVVLMIASMVGAVAQLAPNAPPDQPGRLQEEQVAAFERAIAPYIAEARRTYPGAKSRFLKGLPPGQVFFVTTRLRDSRGRWEQAFIRVRAYQAEVVIGTIASEIHLLEGYNFGDEHSFNESDVIDWLIAKPDGSEEGNVVGKFLDTYQQ